MDEKPFQPTKRKLAKARKKGQVPKSPALAGATLLACGALLLFGVSGAALRHLKVLWISLFTNLGSLSPQEGLHIAFSHSLLWIGILFALMAIALFAHLLQTGWVWSLARKKGKKQLLYSTTLSLIKVVVLGGVASLCIRAGGVVYIASLLLSMLAVGLLDRAYQKHRFITQMKMSKQELKEEQKESEGSNRPLK